MDPSHFELGDGHGAKRRALVRDDVDGSHSALKLAYLDGAADDPTLSGPAESSVHSRQRHNISEQRCVSCQRNSIFSH